MGFGHARYDAEKLAQALGMDAATVKNAMSAARVGGAASVFKAEEKTMGTTNQKYASCQLSVAKRKDANSPWQQEFNGFVGFFGDAYKKIMSAEIPAKGLPIVILSGDVKTHYSKEKNTTYTNYYVYDFDIRETRSGQTGYRNAPSPKPAPASAAPADEDDSDLPF